jgi:hypothetical protein
MFEKFPKQRPPLPQEIADRFTSIYKANREGKSVASTMSQRLESWCHRQVAKDVKFLTEPNKVTLELGAGTLNQLRYETSVSQYDIVEPWAGLFENSPQIARISNIYADISEIPMGNRYDRITSIAVLEHICNLPQTIAKSGLLLNENGVFRASIPSEGTWLWTLGWKVTTGLEFRLKYGLDYGLIMRHEHVSTADEIEEVLRFFFEEVKCRVFGISKSISLYRFYECRNPILAKCTHFVG